MNKVVSLKLDKLIIGLVLTLPLLTIDMSPTLASQVKVTYSHSETSIVSQSQDSENIKDKAIKPDPKPMRRIHRPRFRPKGRGG